MGVGTGRIRRCRRKSGALRRDLLDLLARLGARRRKCARRSSSTIPRSSMAFYFRARLHRRPRHGRDAARQEPARSQRPGGGRLRLEPDAARRSVRGPLSVSPARPPRPHPGGPPVDAVPSSPRPTRTSRSPSASPRPASTCCSRSRWTSRPRARSSWLRRCDAGVTLGVVLQHRFKPAAERLRAILPPDAGRDRQLLDSDPALAAAELLRRAGPRHEGARRRRRAAHAGHPHARPDAGLAGDRRR